MCDVGAHVGVRTEVSAMQDEVSVEAGGKGDDVQRCDVGVAFFILIWNQCTARSRGGRGRKEGNVRDKPKG